MFSFYFLFSLCFVSSELVWLRSIAVYILKNCTGFVYIGNKILLTSKVIISSLLYSWAFSFSIECPVHLVASFPVVKLKNGNDFRNAAALGLEMISLSNCECLLLLNELALIYI